MNPVSRLLLFIFAVASLSGLSAAEKKSKRPNILFIVCDDLNTHVSTSGYPHIETPAFDRLASGGMTFNRAFCQYPVCGPSRASFLNGLYPESSGVLDNTSDVRTTRPGTLTLPRFLQQNGYWTASTGKVFHSSRHEHGDEAWDEFVSFANDELPVVTAAREKFEAGNGPVDDRKNRKAWKEIEKATKAPLDAQTPPGFGPSGLKDEQHKDGKNVRQVSDWLTNKSHGEKPFFIALGIQKPHVPFLAPQKYFDQIPQEGLVYEPDKPNLWNGLPKTAISGRYRELGFELGKEDDAKRRAYMQAYHACVSFIDAQLEIVFDTLKEQGLWDDTIIVLTSDHGYHLGDHFMWGKVTLFDIGAKVPMIIRAPGKTAEGTQSEAMVELVDLYPTLAQLSGLRAPDHLQGRSLVPLLNHPERLGQKKYAYSVVTRRDKLGYALRNQNWRYGNWPDGEELYNLRADPGEKKNLANSPNENQKLRLEEFRTLLAAKKTEAASQRQGAEKKPESSSEPNSVPGAVTAKQGEKPNVLFLAVDDMNDWIGCLGTTPSALTPNIDRLAKRGVNFTNAHTAGVFCAPSRAAIFTGQFASTTGCYTTANYFYDNPEITPLQVAFQQSGYRTLGGGKLFHHPAGAIDQRGWSEFFLRNQSQRETGWPLDSWSGETPLPVPFPASIYNKGKEVTGGLFLEWGAIPEGREEEMADTMRANWAVSKLQEEHDAPFFLAVGLYAPHFPNYCPQKYFDLYDPDKIELPPYKEDDLDDLPEKVRKQKTNRKNLHHKGLVELDAVDDAIHGYLACMSYADAMLGRVIDALDSSPYADNTIIVLWSDHGYHHGEKGDWGKHTLWERTSNVPFIWAGPGVAKGEECDATVSLIDMYPTFVERCDLQQTNQKLEGQSLAGILKEPASAVDRDVFLPYMEKDAYAVMNRDWRYIHYADGTEELYDVQKDPNEWDNLSELPESAAVKKRLRKRAPETFAEPAVKLIPQRHLIMEGETFRWEFKEKKKPAGKAPAG